MFVFNELGRNLLGMVCRVIWREKGGRGGKGGKGGTGSRGKAADLIAAAVSARAGGLVLFPRLSRRALFVAERLTALISRPSAGLISLARSTSRAPLTVASGALPCVDWEPCLVPMLMDLGRK
jgi:hypothetical protein